MSSLPQGCELHEGVTGKPPEAPLLRIAAPPATLSQRTSKGHKGEEGDLAAVRFALVQDAQSQDALQRIKKACNSDELYLVTTFKGDRLRPDGARVEITIEVRDAGPNSGALRFHVYATDEDGRVATGNPSASLIDAISTTHWANLDQA